MNKHTITAVILCCCSGIISDKIDWEEVKRVLSEHPTSPLFFTDTLACSFDHNDELLEWLKGSGVERLVVAACSPSEHETTFRNLLEGAGINRWYLQMVNVREQIAWVTPDKKEATAKAVRMISAALYRVQKHQPLAFRYLPVCTDVVVIGAGPAGMQAALTLARAGRKVTLIERESFIGGLPVRFEELFPNMECGPCLLEPIMSDIINGEFSHKIQLLTLSEPLSVTGNFGAWNLKVRENRRYINKELCIGCMICASVCPARRHNKWNCGGEIASVDVPFAGALPNFPHIDANSCLKLRGEDCGLCLADCPVEGSLDFDDAVRIHEINVGAIIVATGAMEMESIPKQFENASNLHTAYSFERILAMNGPTGGEILTSNGLPPKSVAIVCCAGSLDAEEITYCSGVCCRASLKYAKLIESKVEGCVVTRLVKEQSVPGVGGGHQYHWDNSALLRYDLFSQLSVKGKMEEQEIVYGSTGERISAEMIILMRPIIPGDGTSQISKLLELSLDEAGFIAPLHDLSLPCNSNLKGVYLAGSCRGSADIRDAFTSGNGAAALVLSDLLEGRDLIIDPEVAAVDSKCCSGCKTCLLLCPYSAISWNETDKVAVVSDILCRGCGTCVAGCPSGAIVGRGFTRGMIRAELQGVLS